MWAALADLTDARPSTQDRDRDHPRSDSTRDRCRRLLRRKCRARRLELWHDPGSRETFGEFHGMLPMRCRIHPIEEPCRTEKECAGATEPYLRVPGARRRSHACRSVLVWTIAYSGVLATSIVSMDLASSKIELAATSDIPPTLIVRPAPVATNRTS
jgi:hypothetical protein